MNRILNKISINFKKQKKSVNNFFLNNSNKDYMLLSKNITCEKVKYLLFNERMIICDLKDRDGKIGEPIIDIDNDIESDICNVYMKSGLIKELNDKYLYNLIYNIKKNQYSLQEHDEYYEKIESKND